MTPPCVSVCIPYHRNEDYLLRAVSSVAQQTRACHELILSLDNPLSESCRNSIYTQLPSTRIIENPDPGIAENWNNAVRASTGSHITLLHGDDELCPDYMETMTSLINEQPAAAWFCGVQLLDPDGERAWSLADAVKPWLTPSGEPITVDGDTGMASLLRGCYIYCPTVCYRSDVIKHYGFSTDWKMALDLELYWRMLRDGGSIIGTNRVAYRYRRHPGSQTAKLTERTARFTEEWLLYNTILSDATPNEWPLTRRQARLKTMPRLHLLVDSMKRVASGHFDGLGERARLFFGRT